jgi:hypothetical protein
MATKPKKPAAKKPAAKKADAAPKAAEPKPQDSPLLLAIMRPRKSNFHILEQPLSFMEKTKKNMIATATRRKNRPVNFKTADEIRRDMLPVRNFMVQYLIDSYGVGENTMVDIMGAPHVGKTGLIHWLFGGFMEYGSPCYIQNTEAKPYTPDWAMRFLHTDPAIALGMLQRILTEPVYSLTHSIESLESWVKSQRGIDVEDRETRNVPKNIPLVVAIDTWSKLMNPKEEAGRYAYAENLSKEGKKARKEIGEGSNMGHASFAAGMGRTLPSFLAENNVILILGRHQFDKVDMSAKPGGGNMSAEVSARYNTTSTGGKSFEQNAALQLIMGRKGQAKGAGGDVIGDIIWCRCSKNSYGTRDRVIEWTLQNKEFRDRADYISPALVFSEFMGQKFTDEKWLGTQADSKRLTCPALGVTAVTPTEFSAAFHANEPVMHQMGKMLRLSGYIDFVDEVKKQIAEQERLRKEAEAEAKEAAKAEKEAAKGKTPPPPPSPEEQAAAGVPPTEIPADEPSTEDGSGEPNPEEP